MSIEQIDRDNSEESLDVPEDSTHLPTTLHCDHCQLSVRSIYHEVDGRILCSPCKWEMEKNHREGFNSRRMVSATSLGTLAAVVGAGLFFTFLLFFEFNFAAIPLIIGLLVGYAVRKGSRRRGGPVYQVLAMGLTYLAVAATQFPVTGPGESKSLIFVFISPVAGMLDHIPGFICLCIGLLAAWKLNQRAPMAVARKKIHRVLGLESDLVISDQCRES